MDATYREIVDWVSELDRVRGLLQLARTDFLAPSTLWRSFERVPTRIWRQLLRRSATRCDPGGHGAVDATFFDREAASSHYVDRSDRHIRTLKTTALVDTESCAILDLHCSAHWPHDTQVGHQVALRNTDEIEGLAGTKATTTSHSRTHFAPKAYDHSSDIGCSRTTITPTTHGRTAISTGSDGWPRAHSRPSSADSAPLSGRAPGTANSENWYSPSPSTTSNKLSRSDRYAVRGFNKAITTEQLAQIRLTGDAL